MAMAKAAERLFDWLLSAMNIVASLWVLVLVALISADVIGRGGFNSPIPGVPEMVKFSIVGMVWLQMAYTLRAGKHLRTTIGLALMPGAGRRAVLIANAAVGVLMFSFIAWLGWSEMATSFEIGAFEGEHPVRIPVWPLWAVLVAGAMLTAIQFVLDAVRYLVHGPSQVELDSVEPAE
ncbi:MAG TPA: TRAP transporter small permease [Burkholderiales bacterium]|jgi:TRAP-type C4-dicarboxylate transport system permease small subunit|nr:TRAP transporter small permease [Burkholderiales bacterium]